ncbi:MAG: hypothetical protein LBL74_04505, partial [Bacteroidales bacterium]|nr:hypothetical protein [Bacteroidales bacterium]
SMSDVRKQLNRVYLDVIEGFEFLSKKSGDDAYHGYLEKLNENIIRYQKLLARRFNDDDADQTTDLPESI